MSKGRALADRMTAAQTGGGKAMWYMLLADTLLERLGSQNSVSVDDLINALGERLEQSLASGDDLLAAAAEQARIEVYRAVSGKRPSPG